MTRTTASGRRSVRHISPDEKLSAINRVHGGQSKASVARDMRVPESTLRGWCKSEDKIYAQVASMNAGKESGVSSTGTASVASCSPVTAGSLAASGSAHSSEDEGPPLKKMRKTLSTSVAGPSGNRVNENTENEASFDYSTLRPVIPNFLADLGLHQDTNISIMDNIVAGRFAEVIRTLNFHMAYVHHRNTVGFVDDGLQYTKTSVNGRHSTTGTLPLTQDEAQPQAAHRNSMPATLEPANTDRAVSKWLHESATWAAAVVKAQEEQRILQDQQKQHQQPLQPQQPMQPVQQQQPMQPVQHQPMQPVQQQEPMQPVQQQPEEIQPPQQQPLDYSPALPRFNRDPSAYTSRKTVAKKLPSISREVLDTVLSHNHTANVQTTLGTDENSEERAVSTAKEAIRHGEKFYKWVSNCSDPSVSVVQLIQLKSLLDNLKLPRKACISKQSRKRSIK